MYVSYRSSAHEVIVKGFSFSQLVGWMVNRPRNIIFKPAKGFDEEEWYATNIKGTEVMVRYNAIEWHFSSDVDRIEECFDSYYCTRHSCGLEELGKSLLADDGYCIQCPRVMIITINGYREISGTWSEQPIPANLEEARKLILEYYKQQIPHRNPLRGRFFARRKCKCVQNSKKQPIVHFANSICGSSSKKPTLVSL